MTNRSGLLPHRRPEHFGGLDAGNLDEFYCLLESDQLHIVTKCRTGEVTETRENM